MLRCLFLTGITFYLRNWIFNCIYQLEIEKLPFASTFHWKICGFINTALVNIEFFLIKELIFRKIFDSDECICVIFGKSKGTQFLYLKSMPQVALIHTKSSVQIKEYKIEGKAPITSFYVCCVQSKILLAYRSIDLMSSGLWA